MQRIEDYLKPTTISTNGQNSNPLPAGTQALVTQQITCNRTVRAKLSKLELKKFYGSFAEWLSFSDPYRNVVHENTQLSKIDKFTYVKGLLEGKQVPPLQVYRCNKRIMECYIEEALWPRTVEKTLMYNRKDTAKFRKLYDEIEVRIRTLQSMGIQADSYRTLLDTR